MRRCLPRGSVLTVTSPSAAIVSAFESSIRVGSPGHGVRTTPRTSSPAPHAASMLSSVWLIVPSPVRVALPVVNEYRKLYAAVSGSDEFSYLGLEIFINTKILVEGLRNAGRDPSRESLVTALETMGTKTYGDVVSVKYGPNHRDGSSFVGLAIVDRKGRFRE